MTISETAHRPPDAASLTPLSYTQNFLRLFDRGDDTGPFGPRYNMVVGWRVRGRIDVAVLRQAMDDVVARHDSLRVSIVRGEESGCRMVESPGPVRLTVRDVAGGDPDSRDLLVEELLGEIEAGSYDAGDVPRLRAILCRFNEDDAVLALVIHHTASDGWSMQLLMRDIASRYAARRGHAVPVLPDARPYHEYVEWQRVNATGEMAEISREYWREKLRDARMLAVPTDWPRSAGREKVCPVYRFSISAQVTAKALEFARAMRSSPFMVLLAAYNIVLRRMTGATDLVVPTITSGRREPEFHETVGPFFNFLPLRTDVAGCRTFREVVERTRTTCLEAYSYEIPFLQIIGEAPEVTGTLAEDHLAPCAFQVWQFSTVMDREQVGDLEISEVRSRVLSQVAGTDIPDGALLTLDIDPSGQIFGNQAYNSDLFTEATMVGMVSEFCRILEAGVTDPDHPLAAV
ncbi:condensation domain-containing protein [Sphaerimonospora thailandensis]|uniref:Condensation domain-containing protein n=1 Tax=Sphaerimonospora thailandensis TaxID=795644 RepID=A0A8J3R4H4_9ACTN|nr:condensation domain-containing protein [Sphaerimonospora thailandensis]GIH67784.1 hypothetical protein Mth01_00370 [Sphaerimonospora thailandensis]